MKEKILLKIALIISIVGIVLLFYATEKMDVEEQTIDRITKDNLDETVKISGKITKITDMGTVMFFDIEQKNTMPVLVFKKEDVNIGVGDYVQVIGKVEDYEGKREVIASQIIK